MATLAMMAMAMVVVVVVVVVFVTMVFTATTPTSTTHLYYLEVFPQGRRSSGPSLRTACTRVVVVVVVGSERWQRGLCINRNVADEAVDVVRDIGVAVVSVMAMLPRGLPRRFVIRVALPRGFFRNMYHMLLALNFNFKTKINTEYSFGSF